MAKKDYRKALIEAGAETFPCLAEVQLIYKTKIKPSEMPKITQSSEAYDIFMKVFNQDTIEHCESFVVLLMNRANRVLGWSRISQGGMGGTIVDVKIIMQLAITGNASSIMICHNHPSGNLKPSEADIRITKSVKECCKIMEINLIDHLIITTEGHYSFADEGML